METCGKSISGNHTCRLALVLLLIGLNGCTTWRSLRATTSLRGTHPLSPTESLNLGVSYERDGKLDLALREYERAATGATESLALTYQGNIYAARNETALAERRYRAALKADAGNVMALNNLAWLLAQNVDTLAEAEALIRQALALDPEPREPYEHTLQVILGK